MVAVRAGAHPDFDRFVIQFDKAVPAYEARPQPTASFMLDPSGQSVTLQGRAGVSIKLRGTSGQGTFNGPSDLRPAFVELREARLLGDFERVVTWGLGLTRPACLRTFSLDAPPRLVVDVRAV